MLRKHFTQIGVSAIVTLLALILGLFWAVGAFAADFKSDVITFTAPTQYTDGSPLPAADILEFRVYWSAANGGPYTLMESAPPASTSVTYFRSPPYMGKRCYVLTTVVQNGMESANSNEACKNVQRPNSVVIEVR